MIHSILIHSKLGHFLIKKFRNENFRRLFIRRGVQRFLFYLLVMIGCLQKSSSLDGRV